jgi:Fe-S oxidoreductase
MPLRRISRPDLAIGSSSVMPAASVHSAHKPRILYFAGCMSHLSPSIIRSMTRILDEAGSAWQFYDPDGRACCGRPLKLAGQAEGAKRIREELQAGLLATGAELLVTSCPICFRMFNEDYILPGMKVMHHTQYILELIAWKRIHPEKSRLSAAYHEPCELGRGSGVTREPRELLSELYGNDVTADMEGLCCGGSLGAPGLEIAARRAVARGAYEELTTGHPDVLITACPLCKKSMSPVASVPVLDFAEAVANSLSALSVQPETLRSLKTPHKQPVAAD